MKMTDKEYYELIKKFFDQQYTQGEESVSDEFLGSWTPADSAGKEKLEKLKLKESPGICDLTKVKKDKMMDLIVKSSGMRIGFFIAKIVKSEYYSKDMKDLMLDLTLYEEKNKTTSGKPGALLNKIDPIKDYRFSKCAWVSYWNNLTIGKNIPIETVLDICRWLQGIRKLTAFI